MTGLGHHEEPHTTTEPSTNGSEARRPSTDADLVRRLQADGLGAFDPFFDRFRGPIFRAAYAITGDAHIAEEILHETFTRAFRHRRTLRTDISPLPWLQRVALNL